jgi:hypothetical protein
MWLVLLTGAAHARYLKKCLGFKNKIFGLIKVILDRQ